MTLYEQIRQDLKDAMKNKNSSAKMVYASVIAKITNAEKSGKYTLPLDEDTIVGLIQKEIKELEETRSFYAAETAGYIDTTYKIELLKLHLPTMYTDEEVMEFIREAKAIETNPGKVTGIVAKQVGNRFDKKRIKDLVNKI